MATVTVYAEDKDMGITSGGDIGEAYAPVREGTSTFTLLAQPNLSVGQTFSNSQYTCYEGFLSFDTSTVGLHGGVTLSLYGSTNSSTTDFIAEARLNDWGTTLEAADYVPGSGLSANALLATWNSSSYVAAYNDFTESGTSLRDNLNLSGFTRITINSDRHRLGTAPPDQELVFFVPTSFTGTTSDPKLIIIVVEESIDNILNPSLDVTIGGWTTDTGGTTDLYAAIDELTASDTDYIQSPPGPTTAQYYETALETKADPLSSSGHIVHYRYQKNVAGGNVGLTASLVQGTPVTELLTANQQSLETDTTGWAGGTNTVLARSTAEALIGVGSLQMTRNGINGTVVAFTPAGTSGFAVSPGQVLSVAGSVKSGAAANTAQLQLTWYNAAGGTIGTVVSSAVATSTSAWTALTLSAIAPALTAFGAMVVSLGSTVSGDSHFWDAMSVSVAIASWSHTNISNSWTQQDQTLSGGEADSITDYSDLRLRFTPNMVTSDQTTPVPTFVADRASANSNSAVTTVDLVLTGLTVGNYLIVRSAADNSGGGGAARSFVPSNFSGTAMGTHTEYQQNNDPGAASAGVTCNVSVIKIAATSGTIRLTYGGTVVQACVAEEWSGIHATTPVVGTPVGADGTASTNMASLTDASIALGNVAYAAMAIEGPSTDVYVQDTDTTGGAWVDLTKVGTTNITADTNMTTYGGRKAPTAAGAQTYDPTIVATARDSAGIILELRAAAAPTPTIKTQVSWANFELPEGPTSISHFAGAQVGVKLPDTGIVMYGTAES